MKSKSFLCVYTAVDLLAIFERYSVVRVYPQNEGQMEALVQMRDNPHLDFWTEIGLNRPVDIMMTPYMKSSVPAQLESLGMKVSTMIQDVESLIEEERKSKPELRGGVGQMTWDDYYSFDQVENG